MKLKIVIAIGILMVSAKSIAQTVDSSQIKKEYTNIEDALKAPEKVYRLNLTNQKIKLNSEDWAKFINLEYLSLKMII